MKTLADVNLRLGFTSREGGPVLRRAAQAASRTPRCRAMAGAGSTFAR